MKKIKSIVTGGAGFIGSNLVDRLVEEGHKVIVLDNFVTGKRGNLLNHLKKNVKIVKLDISNAKNLDKYFKGVSYVYHLAGLAEIVPSIKNPRKYFINNPTNLEKTEFFSKNIFSIPMHPYLKTSQQKKIIKCLL